MRFHEVGRCAQPVKVRVAQRKGDARVRTVEGELEADLFRVLDVTGRLAQLVGNILRTNTFRPLFRRDETDPGLHAGAARHDGRVPDQSAVDLWVLFVGDLGRRNDACLQLVAHLHDALERRAVRHLDADLDQVGFDLRHELERHDTARLQRDRNRENREEEGQCRVPELDRQFENRAVEVACKPQQAVGDPALELHQSASRPFELLLLHVRKVGRKDQQALDNGNRQRDDHHEGDLLREHARRPGHESPGQEGDDGGQNAEDDRLHHQLCADDGGVNAVAPSAFDFLVDILADDDGVIDDHADHQQHGKGRQDVPGHTHRREKHDAPGECREDADSDPYGDDRTKEQQQDDHHQDGAGQCRRADQVHPVLEGLGIVPQDVDLHAFRQDAVGRVVGALDIVAEALGIPRDIHVVGFRDHHEGRRAPVEARLQLLADEAVDHGGHIRDTDGAFFARLADDDFAELLGRVGEVARGQLDVADRRFNPAAGGVQRGLPHGIRHVGQAEAEAAQRLLGHFDADLFVQRALQHRELAAGLGRNLVTDLVTDLAKGPRIEVAVHSQTHEPVALFPALDLRLEGRLGQVVDLVDAQLHLVEEGVHVDIVAAADVDHAEAFARNGGDAVEAVDVGHRFLDPGHDLVFDVAR